MQVKQTNLPGVAAINEHGILGNMSRSCIDSPNQSKPFRSTFTGDRSNAERTTDPNIMYPPVLQCTPRDSTHQCFGVG